MGRKEVSILPYLNCMQELDLGKINGVLVSGASLEKRSKIKEQERCVFCGVTWGHSWKAPIPIWSWSHPPATTSNGLEPKPSRLQVNTHTQNETYACHYAWLVHATSNTEKNSVHHNTSYYLIRETVNVLKLYFQHTVKIFVAGNFCE